MYENGEKVLFKTFNEEATFVKYNQNGTVTIILKSGPQIDTFPGDIAKLNK